MSSEMPSDTQVGRGVVYGMANNGQTIAITGIAGILDSTKIQHRFETEWIKDELGFTAAGIAVDPHLDMDIAWTPTGASRAAAYEGAVILDPMSKVTLSNFNFDPGGKINADWLYVGDQAIDLTKKAAKFTLKLRRWMDDDQNKAMTTLIPS